MPLPSNNLKALPIQQFKVFPISDLARHMEEYCRDHRQSRLNKFQTPLWCDRYESCLHCMMDFANRYVPPQTAKGEK